MKYYTSGAPDSKTLLQFDSVDAAIEQAQTEVQRGENIRYHNQRNRRFVVAVVAVVEEDMPPVKVTRFDKSKR